MPITVAYANESVKPVAERVVGQLQRTGNVVELMAAPSASALRNAAVKANAVVILGADTYGWQYLSAALRPALGVYRIPNPTKYVTGVWANEPENRDGLKATRGPLEVIVIGAQGIVDHILGTNANDQASTGPPPDIMLDLGEPTPSPDPLPIDLEVGM